MTSWKPARTAGPCYRCERQGLLSNLVSLFRSAPNGRPGSAIGTFALATTGGYPLRSGDIFRNARPVLLICGSITCPATESAVPGLKKLHLIYGSRVRFVLVNVREAHPGRTLPQPQTTEEKLSRAVELKARHSLPFEVAVDTLEGEFHQSIGAKPNSAHIIDHRGLVLFRAQWASGSSAIGDALAAVANGRVPPTRSVANSFNAVAQMIGHLKPVLAAAGRGALLDVWKFTPSLAILMMLSETLSFLPRARRGYPSFVLAALLGLLVWVVACFSDGELLAWLSPKPESGR